MRDVLEAVDSLCAVVVHLAYVCERCGMSQKEAERVNEAFARYDEAMGRLREAMRDEQS